MRTNGDNYLYEIQLSSITSSTNPACSGANICQVKPNDRRFSRKVGTSDKTKYYIQGNLLLPVNGSCVAFQRKAFHKSTVWNSQNDFSSLCELVPPRGQRQKETITSHSLTVACH